MLARAAAAEVLLGNNNVALLNLLHEVGVKVFQAMLREPLGLGGIQVAGRNDDVGVDVAPVTMRGTLEMHEWNLPFPLVQIFRQTDVAQNGACRGNSRRGEVHLARRVAHAADEVAVACGNRALTCGEDAHITTQARAARRR